jgi:hypothetical protein
LLYVETISEEQVFRIISLWGQRTKVPLTSFRILEPQDARCYSQTPPLVTVHVCSSVCRTHTEYDLRKMLFETSTMISKRIDVKCTTASVQFETIPDSPTGIFKFKCLIMKSVCQCLHVVQAHGFQSLQQWWCSPPM